MSDRVIRVSDQVYRQLSELAHNQGIAMAAALDIFIKDPGVAVDSYKVKADLLDKLWLDLGQSSEVSWEGFTEAIRNGSLAKHFQELYEAVDALEGYQVMFACSKCGKPLFWSPNDKLGQAVKAYVTEKGWAHSTCLKEQQRSLTR